jgi:hypothetical protein
MRYFHRKKFAPIRFVSQGRPSLNSNLFRSEKLEQIFFHKFFAWTRLNKPLASHKTIYGHKDLDIWFSTDRISDPSCSVCNGKIFEPIFGIFRYYAITENFGRFRSVFRFLCLHYLFDENFYLDSEKLSNLCK